MAELVEQPRDRDLLTRLQGGDLEALGTLYDRHHRRVYRTALAVTSDAEAAADLLQDVFLRLHRFSHRVDPERPLEPWLYRVTTNLAYTWLKRRNRWRRYLAEMREWILRERRPSPHQMLERDEQVTRVRAAIAALPLSQRVVVVLYYVNDLSLQEISQILEIPAGTVKSRLHYARRSLRKRLGMQSDLASEVRYEYT